MQNTTITEIIKSIDINDQTIQDKWVSMQDVNERVFNNYDWLDETDETRARIKAFQVMSWLCTDTHVGITAYFLDDEFAFIEIQNARKSPKEFEFANKEMFDKVKVYIESMQNKDNENEIVFMNPEYVMDKFYSNNYSSQFLHDYAFYDGEIVDIIDKFRSGYEGKYNFHNIKIKHANGKKEVVDCRELKLMYCTPYNRTDYEARLV